MIKAEEKTKICIVGNPNSGKTTLFNAFTGGNQTVGNWPGVTVEQIIGKCFHQGREIEVVDLPGIYALSTASLDEKIAKDYILKEKPDLIINIIDGENLERSLYLTTQLIEIKRPLVVVLNMADRVKRKNITIKTEELSRLFDCPVVSMVANKKQGLWRLQEVVAGALEEKKIPSPRVDYPSEIEGPISELIDVLHQERLLDGYDERWVALKVLEDDTELEQIKNNQRIQDIRRAAQQKVRQLFDEDIDIIIADRRYGFINSICKQVVDDRNRVRRSISDAIDKVVLNRFLGIPAFLLAMYFTFWITISLGGCFIDFFDILFGTIFVDGFGFLLESWGTPVFLKTLLADGVGGGIQTVATFIPPIFLIFLCLAVLEDSGYMARAAFVMDRAMRMIGLPGKAFVPLLIGFGCNVPAIMSTRTLEKEKDRILAIMMNPFMSCGARMPVYALFAAAFFPHNGGMVVFALYLLGIILAAMTAFILKNTVLKGEPSAFIMELPPYHIPTLNGVLIHTWARLKAFIINAGKVIILVILILSFLNSIGTDGSFGNENSTHSVLSKAGQAMVHVFKPMGMREENWPAAVGIITGIFAKETVIGTLDSLYSQIDAKEIKGEEDDSLLTFFDFKNRIKEAFLTIPKNLSRLTLPFSFVDLIKADVNSAVKGLEVRDKTYSSLVRRFDGQAGAFAYMLMILLYMPCIPAVGAVYKELNFRWTLFSALYLSCLAWLISTLFYQVFRFNHHPKTSMAWIVFVLGVFLVFIVTLKQIGNRRKQSSADV